MIKSMVYTEQWANAISIYLKTKKQLHCASYEQITTKLAEVGISQTKANLASKFSNGTLGAPLFIASLLALGEESIDIKEILAIYTAAASK